MPHPTVAAPADLSEYAARPNASLPLLAATAGNRTRLLTDEGEVLPEMLGAVRSARRQIDFSMFSLADSGAGREMVDALVERAAAGVAVHVTLDQMGSVILPFGSTERMLERLRAAGAKVAINNRITRDGLMPVDHRKLLVVDGETAYTGGMNFSKKFGKWHDVMVRVDGPAARQFSAHFLDRWVDLAGSASEGQRALLAQAPGQTAAAGGAAAVDGAGRGVAMLANFPKRDLFASDHLLANLELATRRAWVMTPTLSDPAVVDAMKAAAQRGIDVRVAVSGPEGWIGTRALGLVGSTFYRELVAAGVQVFEQPGMSHAKVSLIDDVASAGSLNMTRRAMLWDHELMLASDEPGFVGQVEHLFTTDFDKSTRVSAERAESFGSRLGERIRRATGLKW